MLIITINQREQQDNAILMPASGGFRCGEDKEDGENNYDVVVVASVRAKGPSAAKNNNYAKRNRLRYIILRIFAARPMYLTYAMEEYNEVLVFSRLTPDAIMIYNFKKLQQLANLTES